MLLVFPAAPGLQGDGGNVTLGLLGGDSVAGGDNAPTGTPTPLQWSSGFVYQVRGTASNGQTTSKLLPHSSRVNGGHLDTFTVPQIEIWSFQSSTIVARTVSYFGIAKRRLIQVKTRMVEKIG